MAEDDSAAPLLRTKIRIESLSDLVFGLALSIGSVFLIAKVPQTGQDLAGNVLLFGFSFLILVMTWGVIQGRWPFFRWRYLSRFS